MITVERNLISDSKGGMVNVVTLHFGNFESNVVDDGDQAGIERLGRALNAIVDRFYKPK